MKNLINKLNSAQKDQVRRIWSFLLKLISPVLNIYGRLIKTPFNLLVNKNKQQRKLEIGPGNKRVKGFETVNVVYGFEVDYISDASKRLPFCDETFNVVFASHVLEHTPWFQIEETIREWVRVLKKGGSLEIWVPDGYKLCKFIAEIEEGQLRNEWHDGWRPFNEENNPFKWANGRLLYGVRKDYPSWHNSILTPKYLMDTLTRVGLIDVEVMDEVETRGARHGWINLGVRGYKS